MKKGIIIINPFANSDGQKYQVDRLTAEFNKLGVEINVVKNVNTVFVENGNIVSTLGDTDFVVYLDKDNHSSLMMEKYGYKLFNSANSIAVSDDKMNTYIQLSNEGINMPDTISSPLCYTNKCDDEEFLRFVVSTLGFPLIVKECYGSFGRQVNLINDFEHLHSIRKKLRDKKHLYQRFVSSSYGFDTRVIVVSGKAFAWMKRSNDEDFRSNLELGGIGTVCELPPCYAQCAEKCAQILKLDFCGVDILSGNDLEPIVCEVNSNAFFRGIEFVTEKNVAGEYAKHIFRTIYKVDCE